MEIKSELLKPYSEKQRIDFIIEQNHKLDYIIEEQADKMIALGKTQEEIAEEQEDRINHLTCTALDLITFIKSLGLTDEQVLVYLQANPSLQLQLMLCQNVYCGVVRQLCPLKINDTVTLTDEMVVSFFKDKHNIV